MNQKRIITYVCALMITGTAITRGFDYNMFNDMAETVYAEEAETSSDEINLNFGNVEAYPGEIIDLPVYIRNNTSGFSSLAFDYETPEGITVKKVYRSDFPVTVYTNKENEIQMLSNNGTNVLGNGVYFYLSVLVSDDIAPGDYSVKISHLLASVYDAGRDSQILFEELTSNDAVIRVLSKYEDFEYENKNDGIKITKYKGDETAVAIPSEIDGMKVTEIGEYAFENNSVLKSVKIPDGVTVIGEHAFYECSNLADIDVPESVTGIESYAFYGTEWFENRKNENPLVIVNNLVVDGRSCSGNVEIPDGVTKICDNAFYNSDLKEIVIPESVTEIENSAFRICYNLERIVFSEGLKIIGDEAFNTCFKLTSISIPESVESIGRKAFVACEKLNYVRISGRKVSIGDDAFGYVGYSGPEGVKSSGFVIVGYNDSTASEYAKENEFDFESISGDLSESVHYYIDENRTMIISGKGKIPDYDSLNHPVADFSSIEAVVLEEGITAVGDFLFVGNSSIRRIHLPDSLEEIGESAFSRCTGLKTADIPSGVKTLKTGAFQFCTGLESVILREGLSRIGGYSFSGCSMLKSVKVPDSVTVIDEMPFHNCTSLEEISLLNSIKMTGVPEKTKIVLRNEGEDKAPENERIPVLEIDNVQGKPGETVEVGVYIGNYSGGEYDTLMFRWYHDGLMFKEITPEFIYSLSKDGNFIQIVQSTMGTVIKSERMLYVTALYQIPEDAEPGTVYSINWADPWEYSFCFFSTKYENTTKTCSFLNGSVTVTESGTEPTVIPSVSPSVSELPEDGIVSGTGDADENGVVNSLDCVCISEYIISMMTSGFPDKADINGDKKINLTDLILLKKILAK